ncbi:hypothetical protein [Microcoleus sp. LEGE 07076]|nr:hypothetical protein [Microcoleus sp. LEGE 07076]
MRLVPGLRTEVRNPGADFSRHQKPFLENRADFSRHYKPFLLW